MNNEKKELLKEISRRLLKVRKKHGLNQQQFGMVIGCGRANYSRIEKGEVGLSPLMLVKLKDHFNVNINYIVTGEGEEYLKDKVRATDALALPPGYQFDTDDWILIDHYRQSRIVRHSLKAYFRTLLLKESETIVKDIDDLKKNDSR